MTVADLIKILQQLPPQLPVMINDNDGGTLHEVIDSVEHFEADPSFGDPERVILQVNV